jgi:hypothetical protein
MPATPPKRPRSSSQAKTSVDATNTSGLNSNLEALGRLAANHEAANARFNELISDEVSMPQGIQEDSERTASSLRVVELLDEILALSESNPAFTPSVRQQFYELKRKTLSGIASREANIIPPIPDKAPELWEQRTTKESPADFIRRVYGPWITRRDSCIAGLTMQDLLRLDSLLYKSFATWKYNNRDKSDNTLYIPSKKEVTNNMLRHYGINLEQPATSEVRGVTGLLNALRRRKPLSSKRDL